MAPAGRLQRVTGALTTCLFLIQLLLGSLGGAFLYPGTACAAPGAADVDGLGLEAHWNYRSFDLGAGWVLRVNTSSGNLVLTKTLFAIGARGTGLVEGLCYNASTAQQLGNGRGWRLFSDLCLTEGVGGDVTFTDVDGTNHVFTLQPDGSFTPPAGVLLDLEQAGPGSYVLRDRDGVEFRFSDGLLTQTVDPEGNITTFAYASGRLSSVTGPAGRSLSYTYDPGTGLLQTISDPAGNTWTLTHDGDGCLRQVTDPEQNVTGLDYDPSGRLAMFTDGCGNATALACDGNGRLRQLTDARSDQATQYITEFTYDLPGTRVCNPRGHRRPVAHPDVWLGRQSADIR